MAAAAPSFIFAESSVARALLLGPLLRCPPPLVFSLLLMSCHTDCIVWEGGLASGAATWVSFRGRYVLPPSGPTRCIAQAQANARVLQINDPMMK